MLFTSRASRLALTQSKVHFKTPARATWGLALPASARQAGRLETQAGSGGDFLLLRQTSRRAPETASSQGEAGSFISFT